MPFIRLEAPASSRSLVVAGRLQLAVLVQFGW
jgi:hypothetical protein